MRQGRALGDREQEVAAFVARELGWEATRVVRVDAFATNAVYAVDAKGRRCVVKASMPARGGAGRGLGVCAGRGRGLCRSRDPGARAPRH